MPSKVATHPERRPNLWGYWSSPWVWRYDLADYGINLETLPLFHTIVASFDVPDEFRVKPGDKNSSTYVTGAPRAPVADDPPAEDVVFYKATLINTSQLLAAMKKLMDFEMGTVVPASSASGSGGAVSGRKATERAQFFAAIDQLQPPANEEACGALTQQLSGMWNEVKKSATADEQASRARDDRLSKAVSDLSADCKAGEFPAALAIAKQEMSELGREYFQ